MPAKKQEKKQTEEQRLDKQLDALLEQLVELLEGSVPLEQNVRVEIEIVEGEGNVCVEYL